MNEAEKIAQIVDMLDLDSETITADTQLEDIGWDSMAMLAVIALAKQNGHTVTGAQVRAFTTVGDILKAAF